MATEDNLFEGNMAVAEAPTEEALAEETLAEQPLPEMKVTPTETASADEPLPEMKATPIAPTEAQDEPLPEMKATPSTSASAEEPLPEMKATPNTSASAEEPLPEMKATPSASASAEEPLPEMKVTPPAPKTDEELPEMKGTLVEAPELEVPAESPSEYVDSSIAMEWEVETIPRKSEAIEEPITTETIVEEYTGPSYDSDEDAEYDQGYDRGYDQSNDQSYDEEPHHTFGQGWGWGYARRGKAVRRINKHIFTWVFSFFLGIYGVDRFFRGQIFLGVLKLLTFGGCGVWYFADIILAVMNSYNGPYKYQEDVKFDIYGRYVL